MTHPRPTEVTQLLERLRNGEDGAVASLLPLVYAELRDIAGRLFRAQRPGHTLQPTALVHEAYIKVLGSGEGHWKDRAHFLSVAAIAMRQILVNHARDRQALKRGGPDARVITLTDVAGLGELDALDVLAVHEALDALHRLDPRQAKIAELRVFGSLTLDEAAEVVGISRRTVALDWKMAKSFLAKRLGGDG
jgi:RNA polymerase sigma factor (TIGR02999 family)